MTIDEIRALIAQKIAGQGTMVDAGGGLPAILNALCDAIEAIPAPPAPYVLPTASAETLGGVKVGDGLQISEQGVLSSSGGGQGLLVTLEYDELEDAPRADKTFEEILNALNAGQSVIFKAGFSSDAFSLGDITSLVVYQTASGSSIGVGFDPVDPISIEFFKES